MRPSLALGKREELQPIGPVHQERPFQSFFNQLGKKVSMLGPDGGASLSKSITDLAIQLDGAPKVFRIVRIMLPAILVLPHTKGHPP
jgi:hypothetical protein